MYIQNEKETLNDAKHAEVNKILSFYSFYDLCNCNTY